MINISIVLYNTSHLDLEKCLKSIGNHQLINKIFLIDNSKLSSIPDRLINYPKVVYIHTPSNPGYGAAHNLALNYSLLQNVDYHLVLNPDIYFDSTVIIKLHDFMVKNQYIGNIMPKVLHPNGEPQRLCKLLPSPGDLILRRFLPKFAFKSRRKKYEMTDLPLDAVSNVPFLSGCFMFLRVTALKKVGIFDENFFMYCEDLDLNRRIGAQFSTVFYPFVFIFHSHAKSSYKNFNMLLAHIKSAIYYFNKWGWFFDKDRCKYNF